MLHSHLWFVYLHFQYLFTIFEIIQTLVRTEDFANFSTLY